MEFNDIKKMLEEWSKMLTPWERLVLSITGLIPNLLLTQKSKQKIMRILIDRRGNQAGEAER